MSFYNYKNDPFILMFLKMLSYFFHLATSQSPRDFRESLEILTSFEEIFRFTDFEIKELPKCTVDSNLF